MDGGGPASPDAASCISSGSIVAVASAGTGIRVENCYVFKSRLQEYAQKVGIPPPEYQTLKEGPSHAPVFKSTVLVNNTKYESLPGFFSRKAAEQSAAEVALLEIAMSAPGTETRGIPALQETGLCKNLLQEYAQKMNYAIPSYICTKQASGVAPFICSVEIDGVLYIGAAARTKKEAEIKAARTALLAIQGQSEGCANGAKTYIVVPGQRPDKKPTETPKPLKVKKHGSRRKWNKRKFMRVAGQTVDAAEVQHNKEAKSVEQDPPSNAEAPNNEAITIDHESLSACAALRSNGDSTGVKETPNNTSMMQGVESETRMQEASHTGERVHPN